MNGIITIFNKDLSEFKQVIRQLKTFRFLQEPFLLGKGEDSDKVRIQFSCSEEDYESLTSYLKEKYKINFKEELKPSIWKSIKKFFKALFSKLFNDNTQQYNTYTVNKKQQNRYDARYDDPWFGLKEAYKDLNKLKRKL